MDCALCYYPNDDGARFCVRCASALGVPVDHLPTTTPAAPVTTTGGAATDDGDELAVAEALAARGAGAVIGDSRSPRALLGGRYRLLRCLGTGGFGAVFEAEEADTGLHVAVKLMHRTALVDVRMRERFLQEARMIAELRSPHIVRLYDYAVTPTLRRGGGVPYLVMELIAGRSLAALLMRGVLAARRSLHILSQVAAALGDAHALGIVHRDVKPDNILLIDSTNSISSNPLPLRGLQSGTEAPDYVKVIDFGVARLYGPATRPSDVLGTPAFISPETLANEPVDGRSDLYSLGILLWQMILGELPFPSTNQAVMMNSHLSAPRRLPSELFPKLRGRLPKDLETLMVKLIARDPAARPKSAYEVRAELAALTAHPQISDTPLETAPLPNFGPCWDGPESDGTKENPGILPGADEIVTRRQPPPAF